MSQPTKINSLVFEVPENQIWLTTAAIIRGIPKYSKCAWSFISNDKLHEEIEEGPDMWDGYAHLRMVGHGVKKILEVWENVEDIDLIVMSMAHAWHLDHYIRGGYTKYSGKYYVLRMQLDIDPEEFIRFKSVIFELPSSNNKFTSAFASKYTPKVLNEVVR